MGEVLAGQRRLFLLCRAPLSHETVRQMNLLSTSSVGDARVKTEEVHGGFTKHLLLPLSVRRWQQLISASHLSSHRITPLRSSFY